MGSVGTARPHLWPGLVNGVAPFGAADYNGTAGVANFCDSQFKGE
jgi:hypothetical protein